jgi:hypothetical protein
LQFHIGHLGSETEKDAAWSSMFHIFHQSPSHLCSKYKASAKQGTRMQGWQL